jgi:hypothetical protein
MVSSPTVLEGGASPTPAVIAIAAAIAAFAVAWLAIHAFIVKRRDDAGGDAVKSPVSVTAPSFPGSTPQQYGFTRPLWQRLLAAFADGTWRQLPVGIVIAIFYGVSTILFWIILHYAHDNRSEFGETVGKTQRFANMLIDATDASIFRLYLALTIFFILTVVISQFALSYGEKAMQEVAKTESYRMAVTIFTPTCFIFFLDLMRALVYRCQPIDEQAICVEANAEYRLLLLPIVTLTQSLCAFQLWLRLASHNLSVGFAALATMSLIIYGLTVCIFNASVIATSPVGIDSGFFYIAMLRAILTEIWVFQFLRVGVENVVHCFTHMLHGHKAENDAAHPLRKLLPHDFDVVTCHNPDGAEMSLISQDAGGELEQFPRSQQEQASATMRDSRSHELADHGINMSNNASFQFARTALRTRTGVSEYVGLIGLFFIIEFVSLIVYHGTSDEPGVVQYGNRMINDFSIVRIVAYMAILIYLLVRIFAHGALQPISLQKFTSTLVMNAFTWVLVMALSVLESEHDSKHWSVTVVNLFRFATFLALLLLQPAAGHVPRDLWLVAALVVFLWTTVTVAMQLVAESFAHEYETVEALRTVFTEILMFETLSLTLDRYYASVDDLDHSLVAELYSTVPVIRRHLPRFAVCAAPIAFALISIACHIVTFGGAFARTDQGAFMAVNVTDGVIITATVIQILAAIALSTIAWRAAAVVRRGDASSFISAGLFVNFSVICAFLYVAFDQPITFGRVLAVSLQPMSDIALIGGTFALWSAVPGAGPTSAEVKSQNRWRDFGTLAQFLVLFAQCSLGVGAMSRTKLLGGFELFHLLRWCATAFALYEVFVYATFATRPPDIVPPASLRRKNVHLGVYYGCGIALVFPPIIASVVRHFAATDGNAEHLEPTGSVAPFIVTCFELAAYLAALVGYVTFMVRRSRKQGTGFLEYVGQMLGAKYKVHVTGVLIVLVIFCAMNLFISVFGTKVPEGWSSLVVIADALRGILLICYFLHFIPYYMQQVRKRALITAGMYLVCSTRLITYGLRIVGNAELEHPAYTTIVALCDTLLTLHVTALGRAQFLRFHHVTESAQRYPSSGESGMQPNEVPLLDFNATPSDETSPPQQAQTVTLTEMDDSAVSAERTPPPEHESREC